jgi:hypothetical protein
MYIDTSALDHTYRQAGAATHPPARLATRLPLSFVVAGPSLLPPHFAAVTCPDAPSGASNYGF